LDRDYYLQTTENIHPRRFFPGFAPSPLFQVFKHNGYETTTLYQGTYFGQRKGPHVDNYFINRHLDVCTFIDKKLKNYAFLGYCALINQRSVRSFLRKFGMIPNLNAIDFLITKMRAAVRREAPQVFVAYLYSPGHTELTFDRARPGSVQQYSRTYLEASESTAEYLRLLIGFVSKEDPNAILYVFGDHGPWISRRDEFDTDPKRFVHDRFGIYGGIFPRDRCEDFFPSPSSGEFMTILKGTRSIIRCLSGGEDAFITPNDYRLPDLGTSHQLRYEDFLYE
jgi:hypothetical protein